MAGIHFQALQGQGGCDSLVVCVAAGGFRRHKKTRLTGRCVYQDVAKKPTLESVPTLGIRTGTAFSLTNLSRKSTRTETDMNLSTTLPLEETFPQVVTTVPNAIQREQTECESSKGSSVCSTKAVKRVKIVEVHRDPEVVPEVVEEEDERSEDSTSSSSSSESVVGNSATQLYAEQLKHLSRSINALQEHREKTKEKQSKQAAVPSSALRVTTLSHAALSSNPESSQNQQSFNMASPVLSPTPKTRTRHMVESFCMDEVPRWYG